MAPPLDQLTAHPAAAAAVLGAGIVLLLAGGHWLVAGSVTIARRAGLSTVLIGLTLVAFGTSSPELFFNVIAALSDHSELSFGNVVGSNIANIGLILGVSALVSTLTVHGRVVNRELPWLVLISLAMVVLALAPPGDGAGAGFARLDGLVLLLVFGAFMLVWFRMARRDASDPLLRELGEEAEHEARRPLPLALLLVVTGLGGLVAGGKLAETGAVSIAAWLGLSQALIGLTVVAVATSLPELATSIIACRRGHDDLAVGNLVGSNLFNILLVLGATATVSPVAVPRWGVWDLAFMTALTVVLLRMAVTHSRRVTRPEGAVLLAAYAAYMTWSVLREKPPL